MEEQKSSGVAILKGSPKTIRLNDHLTKPESRKYRMKILTGIERRLIKSEIALHIFKLAYKNYRSFSISITVLKALYQFKKALLGGNETKLVKLNGKYYHSIYAPGYPSKMFDDYIEAEFNRVKSLDKKTNALTFIFLAVTTKCPLFCEHCLEWDNLHTKETFTLDKLRAIVARFQKEGISQFHLSGGEPMVRVNHLVQLISGAHHLSDFYILTSGFNFTEANAKALKHAGLTGVVISLDHHDRASHNAFRGVNNSYENVLTAINHAKDQGLLIALSLCITKDFISWDNLVKYVQLAKDLGVSFIQLLEPKAVGRYKDKDIFLTEDDFRMLDKFYLQINFSPAWKKYPSLLYHGYYQRRTGCLSGGNRTLYIDSKGYVNACPFCQTKNFNILDSLDEKNTIKNIFIKPGCMQYENE